MEASITAAEAPAVKAADVQQSAMETSTPVEVPPDGKLLSTFFFQYKRQRADEPLDRTMLLSPECTQYHVPCYSSSLLNKMSYNYECYGIWDAKFGGLRAS